MPAVSEKQRRFFGAELSRKRTGKKTRTGLSERKLREFASARRLKTGSGVRPTNVSGAASQGKITMKRMGQKGR